MMRIAAVSALTLAACSQQAAQPFASNLQQCDELELSAALTPAACQTQSSGQTLRVTYADLAAGTQTGAVSIDVLGHDGQVAQTLLEAGTCPNTCRFHCRMSTATDAPTFWSRASEAT